MAGLVPWSSGPTVVMSAESKPPKHEITSSELHSSNSLMTVDRLGSTKHRNIGPIDSAIKVCKKRKQGFDRLFFCAHLRLSAAFENSEKLSFSNFYLSFLKSLFSNFNFNPGKPVIFEEKTLIFGENT